MTPRGARKIVYAAWGLFRGWLRGACAPLRVPLGDDQCERRKFSIVLLNDSDFFQLLLRETRVEGNEPKIQRAVPDFGSGDQVRFERDNILDPLVV